MSGRRIVQPRISSAGRVRSSSRRISCVSALDIDQRGFEFLHRDRARQQLFVEIQQFHFEVAVGVRPAQTGCVRSPARSRAARKSNISATRCRPDKPRLARPALAFLAAVHQRDALAKRRVEHGLALLDLHLDADRLQSHLMNVAVSDMTHHATSPSEPRAGAARVSDRRGRPSRGGSRRRVRPQCTGLILKPLRYSATAASRSAPAFKRAEAAQRAAERVATNVVKRPHVLCVEPQVRLRHQRLAVGTHETEVLDGVGDIPSVVAVFPLAATAEAAHRRRRTPLYSAANATLCVQRHPSEQ